MNPDLISKEIDDYNEANKIIAEKFGVNYIDVTPISRQPDESLIAKDGLHPSGVQYKLWAELLAQAILKKL